MRLIHILFLIIFSVTELSAQITDSLKRKEILNSMEDIDSATLEKYKKEFDENVGEPMTTTFYEIFIDVKLSAKSFKLSDSKKIKLGISNWGCKDFFVPEYLTQEFKNKDELFVEIYKKNKKGEFVLYKSNIAVSAHSYDIDRKVYALKNRQSHCFGELKLDLLNPIKEEGTYYVKVYLDFSNFGYFKKIETSSTVFEVVE